MEQDLFVYLDNYEVPPRIAMVQTDTDRVLCIHPMDFEFHVGYTATIYFERENGTRYHIDATTISGNVAKFNASQLITSAGNVYAQMVVTTPTGDVSSFAFIVHVQKSAKGTPQTPEEGLTFDDYLNRSEEAAERAETAAEQAEGLVGNVAYVEALAENNDRRISNIEELLDGYDYTTDVQTEMAYQRDVPEKALKNAVVAMVGGMSFASINKLNPSWGWVDNSGYYSNGVRYTYDSEKIITLNGEKTSVGGALGLFRMSNLANGEYTAIPFSIDGKIADSAFDIKCSGMPSTIDGKAVKFTVNGSAPNAIITITVAVGTVCDNAKVGIVVCKTSEATYFDHYIPYNPNLISSNLSEIESSGSNLWDEEWESGSYDLDSGEKTLSPNRIRTIGMIEIFPNATYYSTSNKLNMLFFNSNKEYLGRDTCLFNRNDFVTPSDAYYMTFYSDTDYGTSYNHDIAIVKGTSGTYKPYRGTIGSKPFPSEVASQMHGINSDVYDKVELVPMMYSGMKEVNLDELEWSYNDSIHSWWANIDCVNNGLALHKDYAFANLSLSDWQNDRSDMLVCIGKNGWGSYWVGKVIVSNGSTTDKPTGILHYESVSGGTDYEAFVMEKQTGELSLETRNWNNWGDGKYTSLPEAKFVGNGSTLENILSDKYANQKYSDGMKEGCMSGFRSGASNYLVIYDNGQNPTGTLYYNLATPQILDVTEYFAPYGNSLEVEGGGSIITHNADDTYKVGIPMTMAYMISLKGENL